MTRSIAIALHTAGVALALLAPGAAAASISPQEALQRVLHTERDNAAFLVKFPSFHLIDDVLRAECAAKAAGKSSSGGYCTCAAAVTMSLWRSGIDPKMLDRLSAFASRPDANAAPDFLRYQGPELYAPLCTAAKLAD